MRNNLREYSYFIFLEELFKMMIVWSMDKHVAELLYAPLKDLCGVIII